MRRYDIEGTSLEITLCYDQQTRMYIEVYPDFVEEPVDTPAGCPIFFTGEDACSYAEPLDGGPCLDCGSCRFYRQAPRTWIGVCGHEKRRRGGQDPPG